MTTAARTGRLFITPSQARTTVWVLQSAAGTLATYDGRVAAVEAIAGAAQHVSPDSAHSYAMYARSALVGYLGLDLAAYDGYTVPAIRAWQATPAGWVGALTGAAYRLLAAIDAYRFGATA